MGLSESPVLQRPCHSIPQGPLSGVPCSAAAGGMSRPSSGDQRVRSALAPPTSLRAPSRSPLQPKEVNAMADHRSSRVPHVPDRAAASSPAAATRTARGARSAAMLVSPRRSVDQERPLVGRIGLPGRLPLTSAHSWLVSLATSTAALRPEPGQARSRRGPSRGR